MLRSIATVSLGGTLMEKLTAIAAAGFDGIEIFENDLMYFDGPPAEVRRIAADLGLRIMLFQPFRDFEAAPRARMAKNFDRAEVQVRRDGAARRRPDAGLQQHLAGRDRRRQPRGRRPARARRARGAARLPHRLRGAGVGAPHQQPSAAPGSTCRRPTTRPSGSWSTASTPSRSTTTMRRSRTSPATASSSRSLPTRRSCGSIRCPGAGISATSPARARSR